jgi:hypothetical protein
LGDEPVNNLLQCLKPKYRAGSKPRCHLLTHGRPDQVAERLNELIDPCGVVGATDYWMPRGFDDVREAQLHNAPRLLDTGLYSEQLGSWWLAASNPVTVTPSWDVACTCTIDGKRGLLLVEAKAHYGELKSHDRCRAADQSNFVRIGEAIREANDALDKVRHGWDLSHKNHYQLSDRFAWSWKLASVGLPVVLVYLGFLNANEMPDPLPDERSWGKALRDYARDIVPESVWRSPLLIDGVPLYALIRTKEIQLNSTALPTKEAGTKRKQNSARPFQRQTYSS